MSFEALALYACKRCDIIYQRSAFLADITARPAQAFGA
jgi:hypothetical protein